MILALPSCCVLDRELTQTEESLELVSNVRPRQYVACLQSDGTTIEKWSGDSVLCQSGSDPLALTSDLATLLFDSTGSQTQTDGTYVNELRGPACL